MVYYTGREVVVYYISEPAEGQDPTSNPNVHKVLGQLIDKEYLYNPTPVMTQKTGDVDPAALKYGIATPSATLRLELDDLDGRDFVYNYMATSTQPTTFQIILKANDGTIICRLVGCKIKTATFAARNFSGTSASYGPATLDLTVWAINILYTALTNPSYNTASATVISYSDVTVQRGGVSVTDWWECGFTVDYNLLAMPTYNNSDARWEINTIKVANRTWSVYYIQPTQGSDSADYSAARAATLINIVLLISARTFTFTNCVMNSLNVKSPVTGMSGKRFDWTPTSISIA